MTATVVYGDTSDGTIGSSSNTAYSSARTGSGSTLEVNTAGTFLSNNGGTDGFGVGQFIIGGLVWLCLENFLAFDLDAAGIDPGDVVTDVDLVLRQYTAGLDGALTVEVRDYDWGATLTTGDWVSGASLGSLDLLATYSASAGSNVLRTFTPNGGALIDFVDDHRAGVARMIMNSDRHRGNNEDSGSRWVLFYSANASGTTDDPRLVIEHEAAGPEPGDSPLEVFDGTDWQPLHLEVFDGTNWQPLALEVITP